MNVLEERKRRREEGEYAYQHPSLAHKPRPLRTASRSQDSIKYQQKHPTEKREEEEDEGEERREKQRRKSFFLPLCVDVLCPFSSSSLSNGKEIMEKLTIVALIARQTEVLFVYR